MGFDLNAVQRCFPPIDFACHSSNVRDQHTQTFLMSVTASTSRFPRRGAA